MLNLNSILLGSHQPKVMADFYEKILGRKPDMNEGDWSGWSVGSCFLSVGAHSEMKGQALEPGRLLFNFETEQVKEEFARMVAAGAKAVKEPYEMSAQGGSASGGGGMWIGTLADPDGNFFQVMSPWKDGK